VPTEIVLERLRADIKGIVYPTLNDKAETGEAILEDLNADPERVKRLAGRHWLTDNPPSPAPLRIMRRD